ncbi:ElaA protein [Bacillus pakistanensis]|uniref:ElaA protein n=1 Tax=Rossellomorea pakistanensis TaxID=992288 RepID=A0ABS2N7F5_9BACI|nr:GNAT family N-acetyltransferase [Bacillus pakistanensis]MBM7583790.1 ElaA protein [Bacillus pakistanensis]
MSWFIKSFEELSTLELHKIYNERVKVFVVEQNCPYQEVDDHDPHALHVFKLEKENKISAYARIILDDEVCAFGRVLVTREFRHQGLGNELLEVVMNYIKSEINANKIKIEAQSHLESFYGAFGFNKVSNEYLEDGIPHITMVCNLENEKI